MNHRLFFRRSILLPVLFFALTAGIARADEAKSRLIVVYKSSSAKTTTSGKRWLSKARRNFKIIPAIAIEATASDIEQIKRDHSVAYVQPDVIRHLTKLTNSAGNYTTLSTSTLSTSSDGSPIVPYGIELVHAPDVWPYTNGAGVKIADIDTGIDLTHPDLPTIIASTTFTRQPVQDTDGHGTHTAGIMAAPGKAGGVIGVAPAAGCLSPRYLTAPETLTTQTSSPPSIGPCKTGHKSSI